MEEKPHSIEAPPLVVAWRFLIHILIGTSLFASIAGAALALSYLTRLMEQAGIAKELVQVTSVLKTLVLAADALLFVVFLTRVFLQTMRDLWRWH